MIGETENCDKGLSDSDNEFVEEKTTASKFQDIVQVLCILSSLLNSPYKL